MSEGPGRGQVSGNRLNRHRL